MSDSVTITVVLPTYNRRPFLPAAIRSIHDQTFPSWRLLVVNDGGEDVSDVVASFRDSRIEWHDRPHLGKAAALNFGLSLVQSKYVAYMDDDDLLYPDHLAELVAAAEREHAEFVYSDTWAIWLDPSGKEIRRAIENETDVAFDDIRLFNRINHKQILHTKRLADEIGPYDERLRILIDYDFIRRLAKRSPPFHVRKVTGEHYLRQTSARTNDFSSITGLWISDPVACGQSIGTIFSKDPAALAELYRNADRDKGCQEALLRQGRELSCVRTELRKAQNLLALRSARLQAVEHSLSFKLGMCLTFPLRLLAAIPRIFRRSRP